MQGMLWPSLHGARRERTGGCKQLPPRRQNRDDWNQQWVIGTGGFVTEKKSGKNLVATSPKTGSTVGVVSAASMPPAQQHRLVQNGSAITLPGSAPLLCLSAKPPSASPPQPTTPEVNVFTLPANGANESPPGTTPPALLIPIMLAGSHKSATLNLNLARTFAKTSFPQSVTLCCFIWQSNCCRALL